MKKKENTIPLHRKTQIEQFIIDRKNATVQEISDHFHVSTVTIRRDIDEIEKYGKIKKTYGGVLAIETHKEVIFKNKQIQHYDKKIAIAKRSLEIIPNNEYIFMNGGSTTYEVAKALLQYKTNITIVTNNYEIPSIIKDQDSGNNKVILLGGEYRSSSHSLVGDFFTAQIESMFAPICILGINGLSIDKGITSSISHEVTINQSIISHTLEKIIVVADHSKLERVSTFQFCQLHDVDIIITDWMAPEDIVADIKTLGVTVIIASKNI